MAARFELHRAGKQGSAERALLRQAQEPVDADFLTGRERAQRIGAGKPLVGGRKELRQGRAVDAYTPGERRLSQPLPGHGFRQPVPKYLEKFAPLHDHPNYLIFTATVAQRNKLRQFVAVMPLVTCLARPILDADRK